MPEKTVFTREATGLVREISAWKAFLFNLFFINPLLVLLWIAVGQALFPGANFLISTLLAIIPSIIMMYMYAQFSVAFPRSGGDYVYVGRILHPSLGLMGNFVVTLNFISTVGVNAAWVASFGIGPTLAALGTIYGDPSLAAMATAVTTSAATFLIGTFFVIIVSAIVLFGTGVSFKVQNILFVITFIAIIAFIVSVAVTSRSDFVANFNSLSTISYNQVVSTAQASGANLGINLSDTLGAVVYAVLAVLGYVGSAYVGGEVKNPKNSQLLGMLGSLLGYIVVMFIATLVTYTTMGREFLASIGFLAVNGNSSYSLPVSLPILTVLAGYGTKNPMLELLLGVGVVTTLMGGMLVLIFGCVRNLFAWSFDRIAPVKLADVNERFHSPHYSLFVLAAVGVLFVYLTVYTTVTAFLTYNVTAWFLVLALLGVAGIIFPRRKKETFDASPRIVNRKLAGVPVISIVGVLAIIDGLTMAYLSTLPAISGPFNPYYIGMTVSWFIIGFALYWIAYTIQKKRGIAFEKIFSVIPPE
jgi:amino acid transporter